MLLVDGKTDTRAHGQAPLTFWNRKQKERMLELQERRQSLQALLSARLTELQRVCLQEAELTGALPIDFPLSAGEKVPFVRRRGETSRKANRNSKGEEEDGTHVRTNRTLFSSTRRKHNDREDTHVLHGKMTVHRGCHTDDTVRWESSSTSDSTGNDNEFLPQNRPLLVLAGSPVENYYHNKQRKSSLCDRFEHPESLQSHKPIPHPPAQPCSHVSSPSARSAEPVALEESKICMTARPSNTSYKLQERVASTKKGQQGDMWRNSVTRSQEANTRLAAGQGCGYSDLLLDFVLSKQRQQSQPITSQQPQGVPPSYHIHMGERRGVKVTRTKSCGPFLPVPHIQPDPKPHLLPPQLAAAQDADLEDATRSLHKALALEGLRDWYLRNTMGSNHTNQSDGKVKSQMGGGLHRRQTSHSVLMQSEVGPRAHQPLPDSFTFHGHALHSRSVDPLRKAALKQASPGTLV
ncbi:uncharacterized protein ccdc120a isoform X2 [Syngnathoides biaculeatus]|uniref:uncharacterized protein ccdc120a isoform X2 n=1 Tax=Syngnathoides biaculeatus TaxID=300417 RepID=UPI002ADE532C|nr:uncharacterized protein ccdc120a isoform X2 [Syngnathoides biaculeatus]